MMRRCCEQKLQIGKTVPGVKLEGYYKGEMKDFSLEDYEGKWIVLFFYPLDFTFVCPTEVVGISERHSEFEELNAQVLGISVDSVFSHEAWCKELGDLNYPLLSDLTKQVSRDYNVLLEDKGMTTRATFIISPDGILKSIMVNEHDVGRNVDELLRVVKAFQTGELCPMNWKKGKETLGKA